MSFWAATVITNFITVIPIVGAKVVTWVWGRFSVDYTTLMRFYTLHFVLPRVLALLSISHIILLHRTGSSSPLGVLNSYNRFRRFRRVKDGLGLRLVVFTFFGLYLSSFMVVSDPEQYIEANPFVTPVHIVPEWYFLPAYAILRSVPNKLGGVILLLMFIGVLILYPFLSNFRAKTNKFTLASKLLF
jgi:ubiquinol-cytochrome c reductase cytochrome b subunit